MWHFNIFTVKDNVIQAQVTHTQFSKEIANQMCSIIVEALERVIMIGVINSSLRISSNTLVFFIKHLLLLLVFVIFTVYIYIYILMLYRIII